MFRADDVLPAAARQEAMIAAADELGAVLQRDAERRLARHPMVEHLRDHIPAISALAHRTVDLLARPHMADGTRAAVAHQDFCIARYTVSAGMGAAAIWVDRPLERDVRAGGHAVERALAPDLVESGVERL